MSILQVNLGNYANDGAGDDLRTAFTKANGNFNELDLTRVISADNLGSGAPIFKEKLANNLQLRTIKQGTRIIVNYSGEEITISTPAIAAIVEDTNPTLGGDLYLNNYNINGPGNISLDPGYSISAESITGTLRGNVIIEDGELSLEAYNTTTNDYNPVYLNGLIFSGNNIEDNGINLINTYDGDGLVITAGTDLVFVASTGIIQLQSNVEASGSITADVFIGPLTGNVTGTILTGAQPNITSLGTLTTLNVSGNINGNLVGNVNSSSVVTASLTVSDNAQFDGDIDAGGTITATGFVGPLTGDVEGTVSDISNHALADLNDVSSIAPSTGQGLVWNGSYWRPENIAPAETTNNYDFGVIGVNIGNPLQLLLQTSAIDFGTFLRPSSAVLDLGSFGDNETINYSLSASTLNATEGDSVLITLTTTNIPNGTVVPYTITGTGITNSDVDMMSLTGSFTVNSDSANVTLVLTEDMFIEGTEVLRLTLDDVSPLTRISINIIDTAFDVDGGGPGTTSFVNGIMNGGVSNTTLYDVVFDGGEISAPPPPPPTPTYTLTPATSSVNEGSSLMFTASGTDITNGTYYWTITNSSDFGTASGSFTITSNSGSFSVTPTADSTTEGSETFTASIRTGSISGTVVATSSAVTINDTSTTPAPSATYSITPAASSIDEGSNLTFNVSGTNITNGTYYWTITNTGDFGTASGSFTITSNAGSFSVTPTADATTEGSESFTASVRTVSTSGTVVATSSIVTINDTSTTPALIEADSVEYTTPGTYSWTAPAGVGSVCVVAIGGGASGTIYGGGGGGGLGWKNYIPVVPGQSYTVVVGDAPLNGYFANGENGEDSYFISPTLVKGGGGRFRIGLYNPDPLGYGGDYVGDGGGNGGRSRGGSPFSNYYYFGGGGAGGYTGAGGAGGEYHGQGDSVAAIGQPGAGGGGAGGHGIRYADGTPTGDGGGVGLFGQGTGGTTNGQPGSGGVGKMYGGGMQGASESDSLNRNRGGGAGAVRIVWGEGISFPNNARYLPVETPNEFNLPRFGLTSNNAFMLELEEDTTNTPTFVFDVTGFNVISNNAFMLELEEDTTNTPTFEIDVTGFEVKSNNAFMLELEEDTTNTPTFEIDVTGFEVKSNNDYFTP